MTTYQFSSNQPIHAPELEGLESAWDLNSKDPNLQNLTKEERKSFDDAQTEAFVFGMEQIIDEIPILGELKDIIQGESIGTVLLGIIPFAKKGKTVIEGVQDVNKAVKKTSKAARREAQRKAGVPTSQPLMQDKATKSKDKVFLTRDKKSTVQDAKNDSSHKGQPHWEAGPTKKDVNSADGLNRSGNNNKPQMGKPKAKAYYNDKKQ